MKNRWTFDLWKCSMLAFTHCPIISLRPECIVHFPRLLFVRVYLVMTLVLCHGGWLTDNSGEHANAPYSTQFQEAGANH